MMITLGHGLARKEATVDSRGVAQENGIMRFVERIASATLDFHVTAVMALIWHIAVERPLTAAEAAV